MKKLLVLSFIILTLAGISCNAQPAGKPDQVLSKKSVVNVYYFHFTARCVTCRTVEAEARKNIEILYPNQVKEGKITFSSLNLEEPAGKESGGKLGIGGQTLLIVKDDQKINITNEGFLYAVAQPEKFKVIIKSKVDPLLN
jgi:hypothetical protein